MGKYKSVESVWDDSKYKLLVLVLSGKDLAIPSKIKGAEIFCTVRCAQLEYQTSRAKDSGANPSWGQMFFFDKVAQEIVIEVWAKSGMSKKSLGAARVLELDTLPTERILDRHVPVTALNPNKKKLTTAGGSIRVRLHVSTSPETRPAPASADPERLSFYYEPYLNAFKTGDLVVSSTYGLLPAITKLTTNSPFTSVGIVVELPNRYTERVELFVVELTRNIDRMADVYTDARSSGVSIFRLVERFHFMHASKMWWLPLKGCLSHAQAELMVEWILNAQERVESFVDREALVKYDAGIERLLRQLRISITEKAKGPTTGKSQLVDIADLFANEFVSRALKFTGLVPASMDPRRMSANDLVNLPCYFDPVLVREVGPPVSVSVADMMPVPEVYLAAANHLIDVSNSGAMPPPPGGAPSPNSAPPQPAGLTPSLPPPSLGMAPPPPMPLAPPGPDRSNPFVLSPAAPVSPFARTGHPQQHAPVLQLDAWLGSQQQAAGRVGGGPQPPVSLLDYLDFAAGMDDDGVDGMSSEMPPMSPP